MKSHDKPHPKTKSSGASQRRWIPVESTNGTVVEVFPQRVRTRMDSGSEKLCTLRRAAIVGEMSSRHDERTPLAVGDRVQVDNSECVIGVSARRNQLMRKAPDQGRIQVIASNVDRLAIVTAAQEPEFTPGIVDRYWIAALSAGIPTTLIVNKMDLAQQGERPWSLYPPLGLEVIELSAKSGAGEIEKLKERWAQELVCFCGHSGVGKTTLLNSLLGVEKGKTGAVNAYTGKGSHTTSSAIMHGQWIDTPGVRSFAPHGIEAKDLHKFFPEFQNAGCEYPRCTHGNEQGCAVRGLVRYESFLRMRESMLEEEKPQ